MKLDGVDTLVTFHLSQIGDLLFSLPALAALRGKWPGARMVAVMRPPLAELVRTSPLLDETLWPRQTNATGLLSLSRALRGRRPDLAVCFSQAPFHYLATRLCGSPVRAGFGGAWLSSLLTDPVPKTGPPSAENNLRLVESLGCSGRQRTYEGMLPLEEEAVARIERRLRALGWPQREVIVLAPGVSERRTNKLWPRERFQEVARRLTTGQEGAMTVVVVGTRSYLPPDHGLPAVADWSGTTSLPEVVALISRARLCLGLDSGLSHVAAAVGTPVAVLFGPTRPEQTGPLCGEREYVVAPRPDESRCMEQLRIDEVEAAARRLLDRTEGR